MDVSSSVNTGHSVTTRVWHQSGATRDQGPAHAADDGGRRENRTGTVVVRVSGTFVVWAA